MLNLYMLIGLPASGKTTWAVDKAFSWNPPPYVLSMDQYIDYYANKHDMTYSEAFTKAAPWAEAKMKEDLNFVLDRKLDNVIWDQTNLSVKTRAKKLKKIPKTYRKVAVFFETPKDIEKRLASRPGKTIPPLVFSQMSQAMQEPTLSEGFDEIIKVNTDNDGEERK